MYVQCLGCQFIIEDRPENAKVMDSISKWTKYMVLENAKKDGTAKYINHDHIACPQCGAKDQWKFHREDL